MHLVYQAPHWVIEHDGQPVSIGNFTVFKNRLAAVVEIAKRGLIVTEDGLLVREALPVPSRGSGSPTQAQPQDPDVNPVLIPDVPAPDKPIPENPPADPPSADPPPADPQSVDNAGDKPVRQGRPPIYSPEEAKERRREQNRVYYHDRAARRKAEVAQRSRTWWEEHPDKVAQYRTKANAKRRARYNDDPDYRARVAAANRAYQERRRATG